MKEPKELTRDAWMEAYENATKPEHPDALPICEVMKKWNVGRARARTILDHMMKNGTAKRVKTHYQDDTDRRQIVWGYIIIDKK